MQSAMKPVTSGDIIDGNEVIWAPIPGSSQELAMDSRCDITLYTGTRGPGKTDAQLMKFRRYVGQGYGSFWRGVIFDQEYKSLDDLVSKSKRWFNAFEDGAEFKEAKSDYKWVWPTGEELLFRAAADEKEYFKYHGQEFPFIGWNELTKYQKLELFDMMMSCNRSSYVPHINGFIGSPRKEIVDGREVPVNPDTGRLPKPIPLITFATTNPFGIGHNAVKQRFIDPAPYGTVLRTPTRIYNPRTKEDEDVVRTQVTLFGGWRENPFLDPKYIAVLKSVKDPNMRKAWDEGDWDIVSGGPFDDVWRSDVHVLERFAIPASWRVDCSYDWGSSQPASYGVWAEADGTEATLHDGRTWAPPAGTLIQIAEVYVAGALGINQGLKWSSRTQARTFLALNKQLQVEGWISGRVHSGPADNSIRNVIDKDTDTIEKKMQDEGLYFELSNKSPGSRIVGLELMRDRLQASIDQEGPGLYFMRNCVASIKTIPAVPRDPVKINDVDTKAEDHAYDMCRYRVLAASNRTATTAKIIMPGA
jgi:hypothetical protein